jgi:hypothetical protein
VIWSDAADGCSYPWGHGGAFLFLRIIINKLTGAVEVVFDVVVAVIVAVTKVAYAWPAGGRGIGIEWWCY